MKSAEEWRKEWHHQMDLSHSIDESEDMVEQKRIDFIEQVQLEAFRAGMTRAMTIVIDSTKIPDGAKNPTRDYLVIKGEQIARLIKEARDKKEVVKIGDYVLGAKFHDAHAQDHFAVGFYGGTCCNGERHRVLDSHGKDFRANGFKRVERVSKLAGNWIVGHAKWLEKWYVGKSLFHLAKRSSIRESLNHYL